MLFQAVHRLPRSVLSITSQGLVSAANFCVSLALLYSAPTTDYVSFILFANVFALLSSLQNAIFISPIGVLVPRMNDDAVIRSEVLTSRFTIVLGFIGNLFVLYSLPAEINYWSYSISSLLYIGLLALLLRREIARNACLVRADLTELLKYDALYFGVVCLAMLLLIGAEKLSFSLAAIAFALPAALTGLSRPIWSSERVNPVEYPIEALDSSFWKEVAQSARWAIPGVLVTWLFSNGYWFILKAYAGDFAVSELGATRLLFTPVGLLIQGWAAMFRPIAVNLEHQGKQEHIKSEVGKQAFFGCIAVATITTLAYSAVIVFPSYFPLSLHSKASQNYILMWGVYFAIQWFRSGLTIASLTSARGFRYVFLVGCAGCVIFYAALINSLNANPINSCLWGLIGAESAMAAALFVFLNRGSKR